MDEREECLTAANRNATANTLASETKSLAASTSVANTRGLRPSFTSCQSRDGTQGASCVSTQRATSASGHLSMEPRRRASNPSGLQPRATSRRCRYRSNSRRHLPRLERVAERISAAPEVQSRTEHTQDRQEPLATAASSSSRQLPTEHSERKTEKDVASHVTGELHSVRSARNARIASSRSPGVE
jgi:hypothetical protein